MLVTLFQSDIRYSVKFSFNYKMKISTKLAFIQYLNQSSKNMLHEKHYCMKLRVTTIKQTKTILKSYNSRQALIWLACAVHTSQ